MAEQKNCAEIRQKVESSFSFCIVKGESQPWLPKWWQGDQKFFSFFCPSEYWWPSCPWAGTCRMKHGRVSRLRTGLSGRIGPLKLGSGSTVYEATYIRYSSYRCFSCSSFWESTLPIWWRCVRDCCKELWRHLATLLTSFSLIDILQNEVTTIGGSSLSTRQTGKETFTNEMMLS